MYDDNELNIYDGQIATNKVSEEAVMKGRRCPQSKLWRITLKENFTNENEDTIAHDSLDGHQSLNLRYSVPSTKKVRNHINLILCKERPKLTESIKNVYGLTIIEQDI